MEKVSRNDLTKVFLGGDAESQRDSCALTNTVREGDSKGKKRGVQIFECFGQITRGAKGNKEQAHLDERRRRGTETKNRK